MSTAFFDIIDEKTVHLLDNLSPDIKNIIILHLQLSEPCKVQNLPVTLENIIIYTITCLVALDEIDMLNDDFKDEICDNFDSENSNIYSLVNPEQESESDKEESESDKEESESDKEDIVTKTQKCVNLLEKYIFTKKPLVCNIILLNKGYADKIYWTNEDYDDSITATKDELKNILNDVYQKFSKLREINDEPFAQFKNEKIFRKNKRHILYEIPQFINSELVEFYDSNFNLTCKKSREYPTHHDPSSINFCEVFIKKIDDKQYLDFVIDQKDYSELFEDYDTENLPKYYNIKAKFFSLPEEFFL